MNADDSDSEEGFVDVMDENGNVRSVLEKYVSVRDFLNRDEHIYARSACFQAIEQESFLQYRTDVDGCVVELKSLKGINMSVRHLTICHREYIREIKSMLKKHMNLTIYSKVQLQNFNCSCGIQLFYENGWECWLGIIPSTNSRGVQLRKEVIKEICSSFFLNVRKLFQQKLFGLRKKALRTLMKNDLYNVSKLVLLPNDVDVILSELQDSVTESHLDANFEVILFCFRFGEKTTDGVSLRDFDRSEIKRVTVHSAIDISCDYMDLMWSTTGLQSVVGQRGVLRTCLSFSDCGNFQSNLDGKLMDISRELRTICYHPEKLLFIQLYSDVPHLRPKTRFHPVSGCIVGGMAFAKETTAAFKRDADHYLSVLESNAFLTVKSTCRLEVVTESTAEKDILLAVDYINVDNVFSLLQLRPMITPFPYGTMKCIQVIERWILLELKQLLHKFTSTGNIEASWKAFQMELAIEKLMWGHPMCRTSDQYSVNLGPGKLAVSRSKTDLLGFLALEKWTACMSTEDSVPHCSIWTRSELISSRIRRTVGLHDVLQSSPFVLGRRLLDALIRDLFDAGKVGAYFRFDEYKQELFSESPVRLVVHGCVTSKQLVHILSAKRRIVPAMVYGILCKLLLQSDHDLSTILTEGFQELGLKHFPAIQTRDIHDNAVLNWSLAAGVWKIIGCKEGVSEIAQNPSVLTTLVIAELEMRNIIYVSKLKTVKTSFPWVATCSRKLYAAKLNAEDLIKVLSFISCLGLMMNGWYVDYERLEKLMKEMPLTQYKLRDLEIQSPLLMSHFNKYKLFRLHFSIPFQMTSVKKKVGAETSEKTNKTEKGIDETSLLVEADVVGNRITEDDNVNSDQVISVRGVSCAPLNHLRRSTWSGQELEYLHEVAKERRNGVPVSELYASFKRKCMENNVEFRTERAFVCKLGRLSND